MATKKKIRRSLEALILEARELWGEGDIVVATSTEHIRFNNAFYKLEPGNEGWKYNLRSMMDEYDTEKINP